MGLVEATLWKRFDGEVNSCVMSAHAESMVRCMVRLDEDEACSVRVQESAAGEMASVIETEQE